MSSENISEIKETSILIDSGSNFSVFKNANLLTNIRNSDELLRAYINGGHQDSYMKGHYEGFFEVWFNPQAMVNVLSLSQVSKRYRITMDTASSSNIKVHLDNGTTLVFEEVKSGLYLMNDGKTNHSKDEITKYSNLNLVRDNKVLFTKREIESANNARTLYQHCNKPAYDKFLKLLDKRYFIDCPVRSEDMKRASFIYGPENKRGKATRQRLDSLAMILNIPLSANIIEQHRNIMLSVDYVYILEIPMLHTISGRSFQFRKLESITNKVIPNKEDILNG